MTEPGVLIIAERALPSSGGLAVATSRLAGQAAARGERVHLLSVSKGVRAGACESRALDDGVIEHRVGDLPKEEDRTLALIDHAHALARDEGVDLVHGIYASSAGYVATLAAAYAGLPSVVSIRGNDFDRGLVRPRVFPWLSHALTRATVVTAVSRDHAHRASAAFGRPVEYVPNAVDSEEFRPETPDNSLVASLGIGGAQVLGFLGELRRKKGMRFLLPAFAALVERRDVHMLLIGGVRRDDQDALEEFAKRAPEAMARLHVLDYARKPKQLRALLALCDLLVFPSLQEGMPNAVLECMACARPVLGTRVGGISDLIEHGVSGALLETRDLDRLPEAIAEFLDLDRSEREKLGRRGRERAVEQHSLAGEREAWAQIYARARASSSP